MSNKLITGDVQEEIKKIADSSVDLILTDPPYELGSFRREVGSWEGKGVVYSDIWNHFYRVLKDGGHIMSFSSNRTMYKFGRYIEDAGFEIRDTLIWKYNQGMPRNMDLGKAIDAYEVYGKTSSKYLKKIEQEYGGDSYEVEGTTNTMFGEKKTYNRKEYTNVTELGEQYNGWGTNLAPSFEPIILARKPFRGSLAKNTVKNSVGGLNVGLLTKIDGKFPSNVLEFDKATKEDFNNHPMVKPTNLLEYLILMTTGEGAVVLDPFIGSGSTGVATVNVGGGRSFIGIEVNPDYVDIARRRINAIE